MAGATAILTPLHCIDSLLRQEHDPAYAPHGIRGMSGRFILKEYIDCSLFGVAFSVEAWQPTGGRAFVHSVSIVGRPAFDRLDLPDASTLQQALDIGVGFAVEQIDR
ncbi:hypothetical protein EGJ34_17160 [Stenotrophomonas sp. 278]|nr:hypothetical protein EGJ34_17160 [Stenotrophomonas sp. 278]